MSLKAEYNSADYKQKEKFKFCVDRSEKKNYSTISTFS